MQEILDYYEQKYPELYVIKEVVGTDKGIKSSSQKLIDAGFRYVYDTNQILDDSVKCMKRLEGLEDLPWLFMDNVKIFEFYVSYKVYCCTEL